MVNPQNSIDIMMSPSTITIIGVCASILANVLTLMLIVCIFALRRSSLSAHFAINLHTWVIADVLDLIYLGYIAIFWRGEGKCFYNKI